MCGSDCRARLRTGSLRETWGRVLGGLCLDGIMRTAWDGRRYVGMNTEEGRSVMPVDVPQTKCYNTSCYLQTSGQFTTSTHTPSPLPSIYTPPSLRIPAATKSNSRKLHPSCPSPSPPSSPLSSSSSSMLLLRLVLFIAIASTTASIAYRASPSSAMF